MRIGFYLADQNPQRDRSLGITAYTDGLWSELKKQPELDLFALSSTSSYAPSDAYGQALIPIRTDRALARLAVDQLHPAFWRLTVDLWHYPKGFLPLFLRYRGPVVGTVHDLILQHYADHYPNARSRTAYAYWLAATKRSIARFDLIVTVSKVSETAIKEFCERHRLRCPPIHVTFEGFRIASRASELVEKHDKVLHLASVELHKRTSTLLQFWKVLSETENELPRLQLIGRLRPEDERLASTIADVEIHGRLSRTDLRSQMKRARALLLPSEIEGFGLPALEAYDLGTPVVYVRDTSVEEVLGNGVPGGFLLDDLDSFKAALGEALSLPAEYVKRHSATLGDRFSWEKTAAATVAAYGTLL